MQTTAALSLGPEQPFSVEPVTIAEPGEGEVRVRIAGVGLCHTDLVFRDQVPYAFPAVLGHEGSGVIDAMGPGVEGLSIGDPVVLGFSSCGGCKRCDEGLPSYCLFFVPLNYAGGRLDGSAAYEKDGARVSSHFFGQSSFAAHAITRARNVVKVEGSAVPLELLGPLGCGFQTGAGGVMRSLACTPGSSLVVLGGGPVGLAAVMGGVIQGCATIVLVEPIAARREIATKLGATHVLDPAVGDVSAALRELSPGGMDYAFDTTGNVGAIEAAMAALAPHSAIGLVGVPKPGSDTLSVNISQIMSAGHRIIGIIEGDSDPQTFIPELIRLQAEGRFPFDSLIRTFPLSDINEAIAAQARGEFVKAVLIP